MCGHLNTPTFTWLEALRSIKNISITLLKSSDGAWEVWKVSINIFLSPVSLQEVQKPQGVKKNEKVPKFVLCPNRL